MKIGDVITLTKEKGVLQRFNPYIEYEILEINLNEKNEEIFLLDKDIEYEDNSKSLNNYIHYSYCDLSIKYIRRLKINKLKNEN